MPRITTIFDGVSRGAVRAGSETVDSIQKVKRVAQEAAREQVTAELKKQQVLREQIVAYRSVATAAQRGSREQIAAAQLAKKAEQELAGSIGLTRREQARLSTSTAHAEKDLNRTARGALAGSGAFSHLGRSIAFASTTFLGAAGFAQVVTASVKKAIDLRAAVDETSVVFQGNAREVQAWSKGLVSNFGLAGGEALAMANDVGQMLKGLEVAPGKTAAMARGVVELAANVGALRKTDPAGIVRAFDQALAGRTRGLKTYGIFIDDARIKAEALSEGLVKASVDSGKLASAQERIQIAQARLAKATHDYGASSTQAATQRIALTAAEAGLAKVLKGVPITLTAAQKAQAIYGLTVKQTADANGYFADHSSRADLALKKLHASVAQVEEEIGTALLPTVTKIVGRISDWLSKTENQEKVTRTVTGTLKSFTGGVKEAWPVVKLLAGFVHDSADAVGGLGNALKILIALKVGMWFATFRREAALSNAALLGAGVKPGRVALGMTGFGGWVGGLLTAATAAYLFRDQLLGIVDAAAQAATATGGSGGPDFSKSKSPVSGKQIPITRAGTVKGIGPNNRDYVQGVANELYVSGWSLPAIYDALVKAGYSPKVVADAIQSVANDSTLDAARSKARATRAQEKIATTAANVRSGTAKTVAEGSIIDIPTHDTHGNRLLPAFGKMGTRNEDWMAKAGTIAGAPEAGYVHHLSGHPFTGKAGSGAYGLSIYFVGSDTGNVYFMTHFARVFVKPGDQLSRGDPLGVVAVDHIHVELAPGGYVLPAVGAQSSVTAAGGGSSVTPASPLTVGTKPKKAKAPPLVAAHFTDAVVAAQTAVKKAVADFAKMPALNRELEADLALEGALEDAETKASPKRKSAILKAIRAVASDVASVKAQIRKMNAAAEKSLKAEGVHEALVHAVADILGANDPQAYAALEGKTTAQLKKMVSSLRTKLRQVAADVKRAVTEAKPLGTLSGALQVEIRDVFGRLVSTTTIDAIRAKIVALTKAVTDAVGPAAKARAAAALAAYVNAAMAGAQSALDKATSTFETAFGRLSSRILTAFDRETSGHLADMQAASQTELDQLQRTFQHRADALQASADRQIARLQKSLQTKIARLELQRQALTPSEQALQDVQASHDAAAAAQELSDAQSALAAARLTGDPQQIQQAQRAVDDLLYQMQVAQLQREADAERKALDESVQKHEDQLSAKEQADEQAVQTHLAAQQQALQDELAAREKELQAEETARENEYQDERDALRLNLEDDLTQHQIALENGSETYADFVKWLQGKNASGIFGKNLPDPVAAMASAGHLQGGAFADAFIAELQRAANAQAELAGTTPPNLAGAAGSSKTITRVGTPGGTGGLAMAAGGRTPGRFVGMKDTVRAHLTPDEEVLDRDLSNALRAIFVDGVGASGPRFGGGPVIVGGHFYGGTERQVHEALGRAVKPYQDRVASYRPVL